MGTNHRRRKPPDLEAKLDREVQARVGYGPADCAPEDWRSMREYLRLCVLYPGKVVAFRDHYHGEGDGRRLVRREVLCASRSGAVVSKFLARLPEAELQGVFMDHIEPDVIDAARVATPSVAQEIRYCFAGCGIEAWGGPGLKLRCLDCDRLLEQP